MARTAPGGHHVPVVRFRDNPGFPGTPREVMADWARMRNDPRPLARPVVVLAGWRSPALRRGLAFRLCRVTSQRPQDFLSIAYPSLGDMGSIVGRARARLRERFAPGAGAVEVDLIGISMGGLVARALAAEPEHPDLGVRLRVRRVFSLATPHQGAVMADRVAIDRAARDMRRGSGFLAGLDASLGASDYELVCYAQLRDWLVGATRTAPAGHLPLWVDTETVAQRFLSHYLIHFNARVLRDLARRLRGEQPVAAPGAPPPCD